MKNFLKLSHIFSQKFCIVFAFFRKIYFREIRIFRESFRSLEILVWFDFPQRNWVLVTNSDFFSTQYRRPQIFQTRNFVRSNNLSLRFTQSGSKNLGIRKFKFVAKTQVMLAWAFQSWIKISFQIQNNFDFSKFWKGIISLYYTLWIATPFLFQTMTSVRSNNIIWNIPSGNHQAVKKFELVAKTQFLYHRNWDCD